MARWATTGKRRAPGRLVLAVGVFGTSATLAQTPPQSDAPVTYGLYGQPGVIDMPNAQVAPDAQLVTTYAVVGSQHRRTLSFQITPRLNGSFRYTTLNDFFGGSNLYDRSFDFRYQLVRESNWKPSIVVGLQDFMGTGIYSSEYIVGSKTVADGLTLTGGIGWGRLGSADPIGSTGARDTGTIASGGVPNIDRWFRGDYSAFGGIAWSPNDRFTFKAEYSSDAYDREEFRDIFNRDSPWNFGADYRFPSGTQLSLYSLYGSEFGALVTFQTNPKTLGVPSGNEPGGLPIAVRAAGAASDLGWTSDNTQAATARQTVRQLAEAEGLTVEAVTLEPQKATVRLINPRYLSAAQAIGRMARVMTNALPASVEVFEIVPVVDGIPMSSVILRRSDLEALENAPADDMLARTQIIDAFGRAPAPDAGLYPKFDYGVGPYFNLSVFDPDSPVRYDFGAQVKAQYNITPNLVLSGTLIGKAAGNLSEGRRDESNLPRVRTDSAVFADEGNPAISHLTLAHYGRPARDFYSRVTVGYLEPMYAGASAEILWKPVGNRLAIGAEINAIERRDFDQLFGLQGMTTTDPVTNIQREIPRVNGHVSAYYSFGNGFHGQLDAGSYLAGDIGATLTVSREFANGWSLGAYATVTDVTADDFGEGSFDKGLRISIPLTTFTGAPSRQVNTVDLRSLTRDGGARLEVEGRLYDRVRDYHEPDAARSWGTFWR